MSTTGTFIVNHPVSGTTYYAPSGYWVNATPGTTITCTVQSFDSSGNLITESSLTALVHDVTSNSDVGSFSGAGNTTRANATASSAGHTYAAGGKVTGSPASIRMYLTYTGSVYDQPPNAPTNLKPTNNSIVTTLTPLFQGTFTDPTGGDTLKQYEIQVTYPAGGQIWDSGNVNASSQETTQGFFSRTYSGPALSFGSSYWWRARVANQNGLWSSWSGWVTINLAAGPNAPSNPQPSGIVTSTTPAYSFGYSSPGAVAMASYSYQLYSNNGQTKIYDSGVITHSTASGTTVTGTVAGAAGLQYGQAYTIHFTAKDTNGALSPTVSQAFSIAALPQATPTSPISNATVTTTTPTFSWTFSDPGYGQATYQLQIINAATGALIKDTGVVSSAATSYLLAGTTIAYGTNILWRVQVTDTAGLASGYSAYASAYVNQAPTATITAPAAFATIVTNTPTITWTYTASTGGYAQASALITFADTNGITIATGTVTGTATNYTPPAGILKNNTSYQITVTVTDTNSVSGSSATITITVAYVPPADMQGQTLASGKNFLVEPYLNIDNNADGIADSWSFYASAATFTYVTNMDNTILQPVNQASGDGPFIGAQFMQINAIASGTNNTLDLNQTVTVATAGWTPGTTVLSVAAWVQVAALAGNPSAYISILFKDGSFTVLSSVNGSAQTDTANQIVRLLGPQNALIPVGTVYVEIDLRLQSPTTSDLGSCWWMDAQLEAATASDSNFIGGLQGTGYSFDANGFSVRTNLAGNLPTLTANPGADTDPLSATGGTLTLGWDTSLVDGRFTNFLIERRRLDQQSNDSAWVLLASLTNSQLASFLDYTAGGNLVYQYAIRQQITYADGSIGVSANRAIVTGSVNYSPAWYLVNTSGQVYNLRLKTVDTKRKISWKETAVYTQFLGRVGSARDAGPSLGYDLSSFLVYWNDTFGDVRPLVRRALVEMQRLNVLWYLKDSEGLVIPCWLKDFDLDEEDYWSDTMMTGTLNLVQAQDATDY